jgi:hypothetical protein
MAHKFEEKIDQFFKELDNISDSKSFPKMEGFVHEALGFFEYIQEKLASEDEEERKKALEMAQKLQEKLLEQTEKAFKSTGMSEDQLQSFLTQPSNFKPEEYQSFEKAQKEIRDFQNNLFKTSVPKVEGIKTAAMPAKKPKKAKGDWIAG